MFSREFTLADLPPVYRGGVTGRLIVGYFAVQSELRRTAASPQPGR